MRIISKFHDFYDGVMRTGMDREVVYVRDTSDVDLDRKYGIDFTSYRVGSSKPEESYSIHMHFLGFCGHIFKVYTIEMAEFELVFYGYDAFKDYMVANGLGSKYDFAPRRWWPSSYQKFDEFNTKSLSELFHTHQVPLFIISSGKRDGKKYKTTLNPRLKDFEFQKQKDPYTTYQEIFQYVAGVLNHPEAKMVKISDKDKIHKHGFDKWSFRQKGPKK